MEIKLKVIIAWNIFPIKFYIKMDVKAEIEIKDEELDFECNSYGQDIQEIFPDSGTDSASLFNIKIEELDGANSIKSELREIKQESISDEDQVNNDVIKSELSWKKSFQHIKIFMTLKNVGSLSKKIAEKGSKVHFESDEEKFFGNLLMSKFPLVKFNKLTDEEIKSLTGVTDQGSKVNSFGSRPLASHLKTHDGKKFKCPHCSYEFNNKGHFNIHVQAHNYTKLFKCSVCRYESRQKRRFNIHMKTHGKLSKCLECNCEFKNESALKLHMLTHSNLNLFKCSECSYECNQKSTLDVHLLTHGKKKKLYKCFECSFECSQKGNFDIHLQTHRNLKLLKCSKCSFECKNKENLRIHLLTHSNLKLFKCAECSYEFRRKDHLKNHLLTHSNVKQFKCHECDYECRLKSNLKTHLLTHSHFKLFKCSECSYECNDKCSLKSHLLTHRGVIFKCFKCSYESKSETNLKAHQRIHKRKEIALKYLQILKDQKRGENSTSKN